MHVKLAKDYREEMAFWLRTKMDADLRGDEEVSKFALSEYRRFREKLRSMWGDPDVGRTAS